MISIGGEVSYLRDNCPKLWARMNEDSEKGLFNFGWVISGDKSMEYIGKLAGREILGSDVIIRTFDEAERRL